MGDGLAQMRRGVVEYCVLALLREHERYGYELVRLLAERGELLTSEGTIYPLLARLRKERLVETSWRESASGPPRRYYRITQSGQAAVASFAPEWARFRDALDELLAGGPHEIDTAGAADPLLPEGAAPLRSAPATPRPHRARRLDRGSHR